MFRFLSQKQKYFFSLLVILELFITSATPAFAGLFSGAKIPSASGMAADLEKRYHISLDSIQNQGELFNVSANKQPTPEVSLFFNPSDPKELEKVTARAFPMYFSSKESDMYYSWYLKRAECDISDSPSAATEALCDRDGNDKITAEDWKIEAAQIIVQNGFDPATADYSSDTDNDGYRARFGGNNQIHTQEYCYVHDSMSGKNYELADAGDTEFSLSGGTLCGAGMKAVCMVGEGVITPSSLDLTVVDGDGSVSGDLFSLDDTSVCQVSGLPACSATGAPICNVGSARCVSDITGTDCGSAVTSCSATTLPAGSRYPSLCKHLFPDAPGETSGNGSFTEDEEEFWGTDPNDPDTADNGNKDEANIVGLGQSSFTWNYLAGDQVGVAVEGMSMISTKHSDPSLMIMWAFPKNSCPITLADELGSYFQDIKGYKVEIPTAEFDLNKCIVRNLIDPVQGGQATNLQVEITTSPENPMNDESADKSGDVVRAQASVSNASRSLSEIVFDWKVEVANNPQFRDDSASGLYSYDATSELQSLGLLGNTRGNALDSLNVKLDIASLDGRSLSSYLITDAAYLRFTAEASEGFEGGTVRKGKSNGIVKFTSSDKKISAYKAVPTVVGDTMRVALPGGSPICNTDTLDRALCRVVKNEIIGLSIDPTGLTNFKWMINGAPLVCGRSSVSPNCSDVQENHVNFFPVVGDVGDTYTVTVSATDVVSSRVVSLSRSFNVIEPGLALEPLDPNVVAPKFLGQYRDITGDARGACAGGLCDEYSTSIFQVAPGDVAGFRAVFLPAFLAGSAEKEWLVDNIAQTESSPGEIVFTIEKPAASIYNVSLNARVTQSVETRKALLDIWGISPLDSPEINFSTKSEIEVLESGLAQGPEGARRYLASIISYIPSSLLFSLRILLSVALTIFTAGILFALIPEKASRSSLR